MNLRRNYSFIKSVRGFKIYIKYNVSEARRFVASCDSSPLFFDMHLEEYLEALEVIEVDDKFNLLLTEQEKKVLSYYRYHNPDQITPYNYNKLFSDAYNKWLKVIPKKEIKISAFKLGEAMRVIRIKNNISINSLSILMNVDRNTISQYEKGERLPSLEYYHKFCVKFNLSMQDLMDKLNMQYSEKNLNQNQ